MRATTDVDSLLALDLDAIFYSPLHLDVAELERLLRAGVNVVTTAEFITGKSLGDEGTERLSAAALEGGATMFGSGMNPGYAQLLAAIGTGVTRGVERVVVSESVDVSQYVSDANYQGVGWGRPFGEPGHVEDVRAAMTVFSDAVDVLARLLGVELDDIRCEVAFAAATEDVQVPGLLIRKGHVAAMDVNWIGRVGESDVVEVRQRWLASDRIEPAWTIEHGYKVEVTGDPNVRIRMEFWPTDDDLTHLDKETMHNIGMRITSVPVVNAIPAVCAAAPGIATYADLPIITSRLRRP